MLCPKCRINEMTFYEGCLGYESLTCKKCNIDIADDEFLFWENIYTSELRAEIRQLKDKLHKYNMLIKKLKETSKQEIIEHNTREKVFITYLRNNTSLKGDTIMKLKKDLKIE